MLENSATFAGVVRGTLTGGTFTPTNTTTAYGADNSSIYWSGNLVPGDSVIAVVPGGLGTPASYYGYYLHAGYEYPILSFGPSYYLEQLNNAPSPLPLGDYQVNRSTSSAFTASVACFLRGTAIKVMDKDKAVECLRIGDVLTTASGEHRPVRWIGHRSYAGRFLAANPGFQPIRFRAGSLGDGLPRRDLLVSPDHAMFLGGLLVPARYLVNDTTIVHEREMDRVDYYHLELDSHDVILAEGAPSESFLADDSRGMFHNASEFAAMYPDAPGPGPFCAPRVEEGYRLEAIRRRLAVVAGEMTQAA